MGEYADMEVEREIRQTGQRMQREYEASIKGLTRKRATAEKRLARLNSA